jgi:beta-phosphoglucomutase
MNVLKAIVFDFDGVLADSVPVYREAVINAVGGTGITEPEADLIATGDTRTVAQRIIDHYHLETDAETLATRIERRALEMLVRTPYIVPGAKSLVESARQAGLRTAIASLAPRKNIETVLKQAGMSDWFEAVVTFEDIVRIKPHPEIFLKAAEKIKINPEECVAIEDADVGVAAAVSAGMVTVALTTTLSPDRLAAAHFIVPSLADLNVEILQSMYRQIRDGAGD